MIKNIQTPSWCYNEFDFIYQSARYLIPEKLYLQQHRCENNKPVKTQATRFSSHLTREMFQVNIAWSEKDTNRCHSVTIVARPKNLRHKIY
jgi:hypothetical protein